MSLILPSRRLLASGTPPPAAYLSRAETVGGTANNITIAKPASVVSGTLLVACLCAANTNGWDESNFNQSWTKHHEGGGGLNLGVYSRVAGGSEPANYYFDLSFTATHSIVGQIIAFSNAEVFDVGTANEDNPLVMGSVDGHYGLILGVVGVTDTTSPSASTPDGMSPLESTEDPGGACVYTFTEAIDTGASGTRTSTPSSNTSNGILLSIGTAS